MEKTYEELLSNELEKEGLTKDKIKIEVRKMKYKRNHWNNRNRA